MRTDVSGPLSGRRRAPWATQKSGDQWGATRANGTDPSTSSGRKRKSARRGPPIRETQEAPSSLAGAVWSRIGLPVGAKRPDLLHWRSAAQFFSLDLSGPVFSTYLYTHLRWASSSYEKVVSHLKTSDYGPRLVALNVPPAPRASRRIYKHPAALLRCTPAGQQPPSQVPTVSEARCAQGSSEWASGIRSTARHACNVFRYLHSDGGASCAGGL